jgi:hypothetical protein
MPGVGVADPPTFLKMPPVLVQPIPDVSTVALRQLSFPGWAMAEKENDTIIIKQRSPFI